MNIAQLKEETEIMLDSPRAHVLIIDDEKPLCIGVTDLLESYGFTADYTLTAEHGLNYLDTHAETDIVLLDINLGADQGGHHILPKIRKRHKYVQVIMFTSHKSMELGVECMKKGAFDYLTKPFEEEKFFQMVPRALEKIKMEQLNDLYLGILVHDLNNPLSKITLGIDFFKSLNTDNFEEKQKKMLSVIDTGLWEIKNMIGNILSVSRFEQGRLAAKSECFNLKNEITLMLKMFEGHFIAMEKSMISDIRIPGNFVISADRELFNQVFSNILINSLRYCPKNETITIFIRPGEEGFVHISVTNPGSYIEKSDRIDIFNKFFYARPENRQKVNRNFGLGLTYSKMAVETMGGNIWVNSEKNPLSTTFHFTVQNRENI